MIEAKRHTPEKRRSGSSSGSGFWSLTKHKLSSSEDSSDSNKSESINISKSDNHPKSKKTSPIGHVSHEGSPPQHFYAKTKNKTRESHLNLATQDDENVPSSLWEKKQYFNKILKAYHAHQFEITSETPDVAICFVNKKTEIFGEKNKDNVGKFKDIYLVDYNDLIGEGGTTMIYAAYNLRTHQKMAAKMPKPKTRYSSADFASEAEALKEMKYPNAHFRLQHVKQGKDEMIVEKDILFMDYYPGVNLTKFLYKIDKSYDKDDAGHFPHKKALPILDKLTVLDKLKIIKLILKELSEIHAKNILHRDLKGENIQIHYFDSNNIALHILDFGSAIKSTLKSKKIMGTPGYIPPEISRSVDPSFYTKESDLFALGIVVAEILTQFSFQGAIRKTLKEMQAKSAETAFVETIIPLNNIYQSMPDVFGQKEHSKFHMNMSRDKLDEYIFDQLSLLAISLSQENPEERLKNSSLQEEISKLDRIVKDVETWEKVNTAKQTGTVSASPLAEIKMNTHPSDAKSKVCFSAAALQENHKPHPTKKYPTESLPGRMGHASVVGANRNLLFPSPAISMDKTQFRNTLSERSVCSI